MAWSWRRAPDGLIEGFHVGDAPHFAVAVQWHPEWQAMSNPFSARVICGLRRCQP